MPTENNTPTTEVEKEAIAPAGDKNNSIPAEETGDSTGNIDDDSLREEGLKALKEERKQRKLLQKRIKEFEEKLNQVDMEEYQQLKQLKEEQEQEKEKQRVAELERKKEYDTLLKEKEAKHSGEKSELAKQISQLKAELDAQTQKEVTYRLNSQFERAFIQCNGIPAACEDILNKSYVQARLKYDEKSDRLLVINPETGITETNAKGEDINIIEWIELDLKSKFDYLFKPKPISGSGMTSNTSPNGVNTNNTEDLWKLSPIEMAKQASNFKR